MAMRVLFSLGTALLCAALAFYPGDGDFMSSLWMKNPQVTPGQVREAYAGKLRKEGIAEAEVQRRLRLLSTESARLEADRWDRFYGSAEHASDYNHNPNAFPMEFVADRRPGVVLDYAMGEGRNALYLATLGWQV